MLHALLCVYVGGHMYMHVCALYCVLCLHCGDLGHAVSACNVDVVNLSLSGLVTV